MDRRIVSAPRRFDRRLSSWWMLVPRSDFYRTALAQQPRMSAQCDPQFYLNLVKGDDKRHLDFGRKPKAGNFLGYSDGEAA